MGVGVAMKSPFKFREIKLFSFPKALMKKAKTCTAENSRFDEIAQNSNELTQFLETWKQIIDETEDEVSRRCIKTNLFASALW